MKKAFLLFCALSGTLKGMEEGAHKRPLSDDSKISEPKRRQLTASQSTILAESDFPSMGSDFEADLNQLLEAPGLAPELNSTDNELFQLEDTKQAQNNYEHSNHPTPFSHMANLESNQTSQEFNSPSEHKRMDTTETPYTGDYSEDDYTSTESSKLTRHKRKYTGEKSHVCDICNKAFTESSKLTRHMRVHTGERPYVCNECDKAFTQAHHLTTHKKTYHSKDTSSSMPLSTKNGVAQEPSHADTDKTLWVLRNTSSMPTLPMATNSAQILIIRDHQVLALEEKEKPAILAFPSGELKPQELTRFAACRILKETLNIFTNSESLKFVALLNHINTTGHHTSAYTHYYTIRCSNTVIKPQLVKIARIVWVDLKDLASLQEIDGLTISPFIQALAQHIINNCKETYSATFINHEQEATSSTPLPAIVEFFK